MSNKYITVEGCIGSGKTTIAKLISKEQRGLLLLEQFELNPFLEKFYSSPSQYALETELAFVLIHYHQIIHGLQDAANKDCISDFHIAKDLIFAKMNISQPKDQSIFNNLYNSLTEKLPEPDVIVCLQCTDELILKRINERNRDIEVKADQGYFIRLNRLYEDFFKEIKLPKIIVDMNKYNFLTNPPQLEWLVKKIDDLTRG